MSKLVAYFSVTGTTRRIAQQVGMKLDADLFEIRPLDPYTAEDLDWQNEKSRNVKEYKDVHARPGMISLVQDIDQYDAVYIGFPVWWYTNPRIINSFIEQNNLRGKKIYLFGTSGGSTLDKALEELKHTYPELNFVKAARIGSESDIDAFLKD